MGVELTGGCQGFATKFMDWPEELLVGGVKKNTSGIIRRCALQLWPHYFSCHPLGKWECLPSVDWIRGLVCKETGAELVGGRNKCLVYQQS